MKVLFIGGTGKISSACAQLAVDRGHRPVPAQPAPDDGSPRARGRPPPAGRHSRPGVGRTGPGRSGVRRRRRLDRLHRGPHRDRPQALPRAHRPVRLHQLGLGLPDAAGPPAHHRIDAAGQPLLGILAQQDRVRGAPDAGLPRREVPDDDRPAVAYVRQDTVALYRGLHGRRPHAPGPEGTRARRRLVALGADASPRLRQGPRRTARATATPSARRSTSRPTSC